jgi:MFS family permease
MSSSVDLLKPGYQSVVLITAMCFAEILSMLGVFAFPAILPKFIKLWNLTNSEAGWINGIYFAGYTLAVPLLTSLTDRLDARWIYLISCTIGGLANLGFAFLADGFWTALLFRALSGLGLAGTFIPGLKALIDRLDAKSHPRAVSFYTACFGLGMSVSFYCAGEMFRISGWQSVFKVSAVGSAVALLVSFLVLKRKAVQKQSDGSDTHHILDFRPIWKNRGSRVYILVYMCHMWEMFAARSWLVAFLTFSISLQQIQGDYMAPTTVMALAGIGGMLASIAGGELSVKYDRGKVVSIIMGISFILAVSIGFLANLPYYWVVFLCILYTLFFQGDSAAIHAGVITSSKPKHRGATMALQSFGGFAAASLGAVFTGFLLDLTGKGDTILSWGLTFGSLGFAAVLGPIILYRHSHRQ